MLKKNVGHSVRIRPVAKRTLNGAELEQFDDVWVVQRVSDEQEERKLGARHAN